LVVLKGSAYMDAFMFSRPLSRDLLEQGFIQLLSRDFIGRHYTGLSIVNSGFLLPEIGPMDAHNNLNLKEKKIITSIK
jgi:hypothetical protein